jgi:hypothetical protein
MAWHRQAPNGSNNESTSILGTIRPEAGKTSRDFGVTTVHFNRHFLEIQQPDLRSPAVFDASNLSFLREDHFHDSMQRIPPRLNPDLGIDVKRAPAVGVFQRKSALTSSKAFC